MKSVKFILILFVLALSSNVFSQKIVNQIIDKPSDGKSLIYIVRSGAGPLLNFRFYDNEVFLGAINGGQYLVYECEPGFHTFWATSENRDFIDATLEPNAVYVLNAEGQMGVFLAGVNFKPLNPQEFADRKLFYRVVKNDTKVIYAKSTADKSENIAAGLSKYKDLIAKGSDKIEVLNPNMNFLNADKPTKD